MLRIDKAILDTNGVICENISHLSLTDRGLLSQNILGQIRNFVEYIAVKIYGKGKDVDPTTMICVKMLWMICVARAIYDLYIVSIKCSKLLFHTIRLIKMDQNV